MCSNYPIEPEIVRDMSRVKARSLVGHALFTHQDREDLEQELFCRVWRRAHRYDANRGTVTAFVAAVVDREARELLRERRALKRGLGRTASFNHPSIETEGLAFAVWDDGPERAVDTSDVNAVLATLTPEQRAVAEDLKTKTVGEAARDRGDARSTLMRKVDVLKRRFLEAGFGPFP
jgi:DNA-directed RNA polymerase specialized sigma24 family protein